MIVTCSPSTILSEITFLLIFYRKEIKAKFVQVEEKQTKNGDKYGKFLLTEGRSKIVALAFGETYMIVKAGLKVNVISLFNLRSNIV